MATQEDRAHAERLLYEHRRRLKGLELRKVRQGDQADPSIDTQIEDERRDVSVLEALLESSASDDVQEAVRRTASGDFDFTMLFLQNVKQNERITRVEEQVTTIAQQQHGTDLWRIDVKDRLDIVTGRLDLSEGARNRNVRLYRYVLLALAVGVLLAIYLAVR